MRNVTGFPPTEWCRPSDRAQARPRTVRPIFRSPVYEQDATETIKQPCVPTRALMCRVAVVPGAQDGFKGRAAALNLIGRTRLGCLLATWLFERRALVLAAGGNCETLDAKMSG